MTDFFCHVVDGEIQAYNLPKPKAWGNTGFGTNSTIDDFICCGLYPIVDIVPTYDPNTQVLTGPVYVVVRNTVERRYSVEQKPLPQSQDYVQAVEAVLNTEAKKKGYDDIKSAALRAGYAGPFHDEGVAYANWMDGCWAKCYAILADVESGQRPQPTLDELLAELPQLVLP